MADEVKAAMTEKQWKIRRCYVPQVDRHMVAAQCLAGQAFGFTADDVQWLRAIGNNWTIDLKALPVWAASMEARIAALLPPETK